jgi:membrane protein required for colicin V production
MNWVDIVLLVLLLLSVIIGAKKGLIRELTAFFVVVVAAIVSITYIDQFAVWVHNQLGGSPLISAFLSFVVLLAAAYAAFKLLAMLFYKIAQVKSQPHRRDQMGGALVGFLRGWLIVGFITFLAFLLPMPQGFYTAFESSFFGPTVAKTLPLIYDSTGMFHPTKPTFLQQMEKTLMLQSGPTTNSSDLEESRIQVHRVLYQLERHFITGSGT